MCATDDAADRNLANAEELAQRVRLSVDHTGQRGLRLIDVEVTADTVVLSGKVGTFHQKQLATAFASRVAGVGKVSNQIEVHDGLGNDTLPLPMASVRRVAGEEEANRDSS